MTSPCRYSIKVQVSGAWRVRERDDLESAIYHYFEIWKNFFFRKHFRIIYLQLLNLYKTICIITGPKFGKRHGQMLLIFLLVLVAYLMRVMMSISIVAMTDPKSSSNPNIPVSIILFVCLWVFLLWICYVFHHKYLSKFG